MLVLPTGKCRSFTSTSQYAYFEYLPRHPNMHTLNIRRMCDPNLVATPSQYLCASLAGTELVHTMSGTPLCIKQYFSSMCLICTACASLADRRFPSHGGNLKFTLRLRSSPTRPSRADSGCQGCGAAVERRLLSGGGWNPRRRPLPLPCRRRLHSKPAP